MSERQQDNKPKDPRIGVPEPWEHVSSPVQRVLAGVKSKMKMNDFRQLIEETPPDERKQTIVNAYSIGLLDAEQTQALIDAYDLRES